MEKDIVERLSELYEADEVARWLQTEHPQLYGMTPFDMIERGDTLAVLAIIDRLEGGVYL